MNQVTGGSTGTIFGLQRLLYRVDASYAHIDGWRDSGSNRFNVSPSLTWLVSNRVWITANQSLVRDRYTLDAGVPVALLARPGFPLDRKFNPAGDFQLTRDWQNQIFFHASITNRLMFRNSFSKMRSRDQYLDAETLQYVAATDRLNRTYLYYQRHQRPTQNQSDLIGDYNFLGLRHRFLIGYEYLDGYQFADRTGPSPNTNDSGTALPLPPIVIADFLKPGFVDTAPKYTAIPVMRLDYLVNSTNAFAWQDQIDITKRLRINIGGRYDDWKRRTHNDAYNNGQFLSRGLDANQKHQTNYAYRAGAVYSLTESHYVYFSSSSAFQPVTQVAADNRVFEPTKTRSYEVGYKMLAFRNRLVANLGLRKIQNRDILVSVGPMLFEQAGRSSSRVLDFDLEGQLGKGFRANANYGFADAKYDDFRPSTGANLTGNRLQHAPKHTARVWVTKRWKLGQKTSLTSSLGGYYIYRYFTNSANTIVLPSRFTVDGGLNLLRPRWEVGVNFQNLTDKERYFVSQINGGNQLYPGPPFNAFVTLRYIFQ